MKHRKEGLFNMLFVGAIHAFSRFDEFTWAGFFTIVHVNVWKCADYMDPFLRLCPCKYLEENKIHGYYRSMAPMYFGDFKRFSSFAVQKLFNALMTASSTFSAVPCLNIGPIPAT